MNDLSHSEALSVLSSTIDVTHDGLSQFSAQIGDMDRLPALWWNDVPVWLTPMSDLRTDHHWPIVSCGANRIAIVRPSQNDAFELSTDAIRTLFNSSTDGVLTDAEFTLLLDLSAGLSLEDSATKAAITTATRRKQLQSIFKKLGVKSQIELFSLSSTKFQILRDTLTSTLDGHKDTWSSYQDFLPSGIRCGTVNHANGHTVRYLDIGPLTGKPVMVLHSMVFPNISAKDVALFHTLGWRTLWPIRTGCLCVQKERSVSWQDHCDTAVNDIEALRQTVTEDAVPLIALVSSGAYATEYARKYPDYVSEIDYVATCFSAGKNKTRDAYFGDFLTRNFKRNGGLALLAARHILSGLRKQSSVEKTLKRIFGESTPDQAQLKSDFASNARAERLMFAIHNSIDSMKYDYLSQIHFSWHRAKALLMPKTFWHGEDDVVHHQDDLIALAETVTGTKPNIIPNMGHLTQGEPFRRTMQLIAATYPK
ncbi:hypothetical protein [Amylibacter sp. IMCC11727]|uniref:hypothetical protein n=1 Tax=Amylibacter sp. IMCC11727 TaxID=3039851 RepID=UPI00244E02D0|nr:hypothetical protein [Amylibacter sp. IMCC11727]WGI22810.1 hypothetical protein QBD29_05160 [Amylibacter sp. IMCC11727]